MNRVFKHLIIYIKPRHRILPLSILCLFAVYITASNIALKMNVASFVELELNSQKTDSLKQKSTANRKEGDPLLIKIDTATYVDKKQGEDHLTLRDNVVFFHDGAYLYCDTAYYNEQTNSFEAFSNVHMIQGDTLYLWGDYMHYDGNTMLAEVRQNVILEHRPRRVKLYTDSLDYDRKENIAYYFSGGQLVDTLNVLTSDWGQYEPNYNLAKFLDDVLLVNPNFKIYSEHIDYYTHNQMANILSESRIVSDSGTIYTSNAWYNTNTEESLLLDRSVVENLAGNMTLVGDSIFYNKLKGYGEAYGNVQLKDTLKKVILRGHYTFYNELTEYALARDSAYAIEYSQGDSLFVHADTLKLITVYDNPLARKKATIDSSLIASSHPLESADNDNIIANPDNLAREEKLVRMDSISAEIESLAVFQAQSIQDSIPLIETAPSEIVNKDSIRNPVLDEDRQGEAIRIIKGYYGVRFYRSDIQGVCDSMQFSSVDSVLHLYRDPVLWNEGNQISGDTIDIFMNDSTINYVHVKRYSFSIEQKDSTMFNQLKGRSLKAFFENGVVRRILVEGNAESISYPEEKDKSIIGLNWLESSYLEIWIRNSALEKLKAWPKATGKLTPPEMVNPEQRKLEGFYWYDYLRPLDRHDIFRKVSKRQTDIRPQRPAVFDD